MKNLIIILLTVISLSCFSQTIKPRLFNGTIWVEFNSQSEFDAYVATISPTPDMTSWIKSEQHELIGKQVIKDLYVQLRGMNLTQAQEADIINRVMPVLIALQCGFIRGARDICSALTVAGQLTLARKNFILTEIDDAITKL